MKNTLKIKCEMLPNTAAIFLKKTPIHNLGLIQKSTEKIHEYFDLLEKRKINQETYNKEVSILMHEAFESIQNLANLNIAFPSLFTEDQLTILEDLMEITKDLNLEHPDPIKYTEFENGQIGGAATIFHQQ